MSTASQVHLIVNAVGKDRLGIVRDVSEQVTGIGGNVGESQAAKLGSHFSMMMLVHLPADQKSVLEDKLKKLGGLQATVFETQVEAADFTPKLACKYRTVIAVAVACISVSMISCSVPVYECMNICSFIYIYKFVIYCETLLLTTKYNIQCKQR